MKFLFVDDNCRLFVNNIVAKVNLKNSVEVEGFLKKIIKLLENKYCFSVLGLFIVNIYVNNKVGMYIEINRINSFSSNNITELKVNIIYDCDFYFKTKCFEILDKFSDVYFFEDYYYINVDILEE